MVPALFLDRDGVVNVDRGFVHRIEDFEFTPGLFGHLARFAACGLRLIVVTNQSGIGRGLYTSEDYDRVTSWMIASLAEQAIDIAGVYHCPHAPEAGCGCRKPAPGMLLRAAEEHDVDLSRSWLIGDKESDIEAALAAGVRQTILLKEPPTAAGGSKAAWVCASLSDTVRLICNGQQQAV